jgi:hypothetical protein
MRYVERGSFSCCSASAAPKGAEMGIGGGIFLIALGAILAYGVTVEPSWLNLDVVGWVLMLAGATIIVLTIWFWQQRRRRVVRTPRVEDASSIDRPGSVPPVAPVPPNPPNPPDPSEIEPRTPPVAPEPPNLPPRGGAPRRSDAG